MNAPLSCSADTACDRYCSARTARSGCMPRSAAMMRSLKSSSCRSPCKEDN